MISDASYTYKENDLSFSRRLKIAEKSPNEARRDPCEISLNPLNSPIFKVSILYCKHHSLISKETYRRLDVFCLR